MGSETWHSLLDVVEEWMKHQREQETGQRIPLLPTTLTADGGGAEEEVRGLAIACAGLGQDLGEESGHLFQPNLPADQVEGVLEVDLEAEERGIRLQNLAHRV